MEDTGERLKEQTARTLKAYQSWAGNKKEMTALEEIQDSLHDLRKVLSRIEIEMAASERDEMAQRPIPIPPHRAQRNKGQGAEGADEDFNRMDDPNDRQPMHNNGPRPQGGQGGGGRPQHQHRRPMMRRPDNRE